MKCARCGEETPRLTLTQRRCPPCEAQVQGLIKSDTERRNRRVFAAAKDLSGLAGSVL